MGRNGETKQNQYSFTLTKFCVSGLDLFVTGYHSVMKRSFGFSVEVISVLKEFPLLGRNIGINNTRQVTVRFLRITGAINFS